MKPMFRKLLSLLLTVCLTAAFLPLTALAAGEPPELQSAVVTADGHVELTFDKAMAAPESGGAGFTVVRSDTVSKAVTAAQLKAGEDTKITLTLATTIKGGEVLQLNYIPGTVAAADTGTLAAIANFDIANGLPHPTLDTSDPPAGTVGVAYTHTFTATGGTAPSAFYIQFGSPPGGLTLDNVTGVLSGTPTESGDFSIGVMAVDSVTAVDLHWFTIAISAAVAGEPPVLLSATVTSDGYVELTFDKAMATPATGAAGFTVNFGATDKGVTAAQLDGTDSTKIRLTLATTVKGGEDLWLRYTPGTVTAADGEELAAIDYQAIINGLPRPILENITPPGGTVNSAYSHTFTLVEGEGTAPFTFNLGGTPPPGLTFDPATGVLSGTPTEYGRFSLGTSVTDNNLAIDSRNFSVTILQNNPVASGNDFAIAVQPDGTVKAWGHNDVGQLGVGTTYVQSLVPVQVSGLTGVVSVAAGSNTGYALKADGTVWAWGQNYGGALGDGTTVNSAVPVSTGLTDVVAIAAQASTGYALKADGTVWSWGSNQFGGLGINDTVTTHSSTTPINIADTVPSFTGIKAISSGGTTTYALRNDGTAWAWGANTKGQVGDGTTNMRYSPVYIPNLDGVQSISSWWFTSYALKADGAVVAWGDGADGQMGNGTNPSAPVLVPVTVSGLTDVVSIAAGSSAGYALKLDGTVWSWGYNHYGELGDDSTTDSNVPVQVRAPNGGAGYLTGVKALAGGSNRAYVVKTDGTVLAWGYNSFGSLGNGTATDSDVPVPVGAPPGVCAIGATNYDSLDDALAAVDNGETITLLDDITDDDGLEIDNGKSFTIDLNSHNLDVANLLTNTGSEKGLVVINGSEVSLTGSGSFNVSGRWYGVYAVNAAVTVSSAASPMGTAVFANTGANVTVTGDADGTGNGIYARNNSSVTVEGSVTATGNNNSAIDAQGSTIHVHGNVTASGGGSSHGILGAGNITVDGNVEGNQIGVEVGGASSVITVGGNVTARGTDNAGSNFFCYGALTSAGNIIITGNIIATGGTGVRSTGGGRLTLDGTITAAHYIEFGFGGTNTVKTIDDKEAVTTKPGYYTYAGTNGSVWVKAPVAPSGLCEIDGTPYDTLDDALAVVPDATPTTIKLLADIDYDGGITVNNKRITFDLDGKTLTVNNTSGSGLTVTNGSAVDIANPGEFNVTGSTTGLSVNNSTITVTNVTSGTLHGILAGNNSVVTVTNDVTSTAYMAAAASGGSSISIGGNVAGTNYGCYAQDTNTVITVAGNVSAAGNNSYGVHSRGGAAVTIDGNITATGSGSTGADLNSSGLLTVNGTITAQKYIILGSVEKTAADKRTPTTKPNYYTYTDEVSTVWVKEPAAPSGVCAIGATGYATLDAALAAVTNGETITLLDDITDTDGMVIDNSKTFTIDVGDYTLEVSNGNGTGLDVSNGSQVSLDAGTGEFNVTGTIYGAYAVGVGSSIIIIGNVSSTGESGYGAYAVNGGHIEVTGNVTATGIDSIGASADAADLQPGGSIIINGHVEGVAGGVKAYEGCSVIVNGNVTATGDVATAAYAYYGYVEIEGNAISNGANGTGASTAYGTILVKGNVVGGQYGIFSQYGGSAHVIGNSTATAAGGIGAYAISNSHGDGEIILDGVITAENYIKVNDAVKSQEDKTTPTTKEGYYTYTDGASTVWVKAGSAWGGFSLPVEYPVGGQPYAITAGDFDTDGDIDLAVTNGNTDDISVLLGDGSGIFQSEIAADDIYAPQWIAAGNLVGDDDNLDLALTASAGLIVLQGHGDGTFTLHAQYATGTSANTVVPGDFNNDGKVDLAVSNYQSHNVSVFLKKQDSFFGVVNGGNPRTADYTYPVGNNPTRMATADFNGDGNLDLTVVVGSSHLVAEADRDIAILTGDGTGQFTKSTLDLSFADYSAPTSSWPLGLAAGDLNGDGIPDLVVGIYAADYSYTGYVAVYAGDGDGTFTKLHDLTTIGRVNGIAIADFSNDGNPDIAVVNSLSDGKVSIFCGDGTGEFSPRQDFAVGGSPTNPIAGDFNDDGKLDLAVVNDSISGGTVSILLNDSTGQPATATDFTLSPTSLAQAGGTVTATVTGTNLNAPGTDLKVSLDGGTTKIGTVSSNTGTTANVEFAVPANTAATDRTDTVTLYLNGTATGHSAAVTVAAPPPADSILTSITPPTAITGVANGTAKTAAALGLPATVTLVTDDGNVSADVTWDVASSTYDPATTTEQTFTVDGAVSLPAGVINPNSVNLTVTISVTVNRKPDPNHGGGGGGGGGGVIAAPTYSANMTGSGAAEVTLPVNMSTGAASVSLGSLAGNIFGDDGQRVLTVPSIPGVNSYTLETPASPLSDPEAGGSLTFATGLGQITIPGNMLSGTGLSGDIGVTISQGDKSSLPADLKDAVGARPLIQLSLTVNGAQTNWNNPDAPVTVSIPYTPTAAELQNPECIIVWYIDGAGNVVPVSNGRYDPETGMVTFTITHFSLFAVAYNKLTFKDVAANAWYHDAVGFIAARGITLGTGNGNYSPEAKLTRGEFIVLIMRAYGIDPDTDPADNFSDAGSIYYTGYLAAAKRLGISAGVGNNLYAPGKEITRQEMFTLLYNALKVIGQLPQGQSGKTFSDFTDAGDIDSWAKEAMTLLVESGTVGGNNGALTPLSTTTRAEMAQVLYNLLSK